jgi:TonB-dependent SusC/RagA subfamily outer membrane receptor
LVIIDGVPRSDFNRLDPNEVESVTILKDAAAAVYGVRAANGVILITSKKGSIQTPTITYAGTYGLVQLEEMKPMLNAYQWATLKNEVEVNNGRSPIYTKEDIENYRNGTYPSTSWETLAVRNNAPQTQHNLSASGGTEMLKYFTSVGFLRQEGHWTSGDPVYDRYNVRLNLSSQFARNLEAEVFLNTMSDKKLSARPTDITRLNTMQLPITPVYANDTPPYYSNVFDAVHPLIVTNRDLFGTTDVRKRFFQGTLALNYKFPFIEGLGGRVMFNYDNSIDDQRLWRKKYAMYNYNAVTNEFIASNFGNSPSNLTYSYQNTVKINSQASLNYSRNLIIMESEVCFFLKQMRTGAMVFRKKGVFDGCCDQLYAGISANQVVGAGNVYNNSNMGLVGRFNYDYNSKYFAEFSFRYDGSSMFGEEHRWGFFPAVSASWRLSEERFIRIILILYII